MYWWRAICPERVPLVFPPLSSLPYRRMLLPQQMRQQPMETPILLGKIIAQFAVHIYTYIYICTYTVYTLIYTYIHIYICIYTLLTLHTHSPTFNTYIHTYIHTLIHNLLHSIHTHIHTYIQNTTLSPTSGVDITALSGSHFPEQPIVKLPPRNIIVLKQIPSSPKEKNVCIEVLEISAIRTYINIHTYIHACCSY